MNGAHRPAPTDYFCCDWNAALTVGILVSFCTGRASLSHRPELLLKMVQYKH